MFKGRVLFINIKAIVSTVFYFLTLLEGFQRNFVIFFHCLDFFLLSFILSPMLGKSKSVSAVPSVMSGQAKLLSQRIEKSQSFQSKNDWGDLFRGNYGVTDTRFTRAQYTSKEALFGSSCILYPDSMNLALDALNGYFILDFGKVTIIIMILCCFSLLVLFFIPILSPLPPSPSLDRDLWKNCLLFVEISVHKSLIGQLIGDLKERVHSEWKFVTK